MVCSFSTFDHGSSAMFNAKDRPDWDLQNRRRRCGSLTDEASLFVCGTCNHHLYPCIPTLSTDRHKVE